MLGEESGSIREIGELAVRRRRIDQVQRVRKAVLAGGAIAGLALMFVVVSAWEPYGVARRSIAGVGVVLIFLAIVGRTWCGLYIGGRKLGSLVDAGPYSVTRNPLYVFSILGAAGVGAAFGSAAFAIVAALAVLAVFIPVVRAEEAALRDRHGMAFADYCRNVPRFWPRFGAWRDVEMLQVSPRIVRISFLDSLFFLVAIPLALTVEWLASAGILRPLVQLP